jgi:hypothetical protein
MNPDQVRRLNEAQVRESKSQAAGSSESCARSTAAAFGSSRKKRRKPSTDSESSSSDNSDSDGSECEAKELKLGAPDAELTSEDPTAVPQETDAYSVEKCSNGAADLQPTWLTHGLEVGDVVIVNGGQENGWWVGEVKELLNVVWSDDSTEQGDIIVLEFSGQGRNGTFTRVSGKNAVECTIWTEAIDQWGTAKDMLTKAGKLKKNVKEKLGSGRHTIR